MTGDDRCTIEKQSTNAIPPSSPSSIGIFWVHGKENFAVFFGTVFVLAIGLCLTSILYLRSKGHLLPQRRPSDATSSVPSSSAPPTSQLVIPFVALHDSVGRDADVNSSNRKPLVRIIRSVMENYQRESSQALAGLSTMLDEALTSEANVYGRQKKNWKVAKLLSAKVKRRIQRTATCLEHDERVLEKLLGNFSFVLALPDKEINNASDAAGENITDSTEVDKIRMGSSFTKYRLPERKKIVINETETHSYDSATQIWAHIVRDWTVEGKAIRHIIYDWCYQQMDNFCRNSPFDTTVLVPGSGMGRLAFDLFQRGYNVEANELSPSMAAAASSVLRNQISGSFHPYVLDGMANEVDSEIRFDSVHFPDIPIQAFSSIDNQNGLVNEITGRGSLSYTVGDFVGNDDYYYRRQRVGHFDAIVSSIDI
jgi:SAM-dependent methyltransferase